MPANLKIALVAGETSGDILGAGLIRELKKLYPQAQFAGIGGELMIAEGLQTHVPMERLSVMGITEVLGRLPELLNIRKNLCQWLIDWQADVFIGIDAPDFNLGLEAKLRQAGIKTAHYVSPSVWAWRKGRIKKIRKAVDHMLTLLPFEADFYQQEQIPVTFVGHTLASQIPMDCSQQTNQMRQQFGLEEGAKVVAMLPGSRASEVAKLTELFLTTLQLTQKQVGKLQVLIPAANKARRAQIEQLAKPFDEQLAITIVDQQATEVITASDAVLVASGTATLQTMLLKKPMVVAYKLSAFSFWLISKLATTRWVALPNILEQRDWVPERLQENAQADILADDLIRALSDDAYRQDFIERANGWHKKLAINADEQAAQAIASLVN